MITFLRKLTGTTKAQAVEQARFDKNLTDLDCKETELDDLRTKIKEIQFEMVKKGTALRSLSPPPGKVVIPDERPRETSEPYRRPVISKA